MPDDLYREIILDRYRDPQYQGELAEAPITAHESNPLCGDELEVQLHVVDGAVESAAWTGTGCAISLVSADMLCEKLIGLSLDQIKAMSKDDIVNLISVDLSPTRLKCALLSLSTVHKGLREHGYFESSN